MHLHKLLQSITLLSSVLISPAKADKLTAEELLASRDSADMTYKQLMEVMGESASMMHKGILRQNKIMVKTGADFILNHPAPNHKPWDIVKKEEKKHFKQSLLTFDPILDKQTLAVVEEVEKGNWFKANKALAKLNSSCISCHVTWKHKVIKYPSL